MHMPLALLKQTEYAWLPGIGYNIHYSTVIRCYFLVTQGVIVIIQSIVEGFKVACLLHVVLDTPLRWARVTLELMTW